MRIILSEETYALIRDGFAASERENFDVKGFGSLLLHNLDYEIWTQR